MLRADYERLRGLASRALEECDSLERGEPWWRDLYDEVHRQ